MEVMTRNTLEVFGRWQFSMYRADICSRGPGYIVRKRRGIGCGIIGHILWFVAQSICLYMQLKEKRGGEGGGHVQEPLERYVRTEVVDLGQSGSVVHCRRQLPEQGEHNGNFGPLDAL